MNNLSIMNLRNRDSILFLLERTFQIKPDFLINISASPFSFTKIEAKESIFRSKAVKYGIPVIMVTRPVPIPNSFLTGVLWLSMAKERLPTGSLF